MYVVGLLSERVKAVAEHSEAQTSHVAGVVTQQLEKGLEAVATSAAMSSEQNTCAAVEEMQKEVQTQLEQNRVDWQRHNEETQPTASKIVAGLE